MAKYRLVKEVNNAAIGHAPKYVIEKKVLWWWSQNYLLCLEGCFTFYNESEARNMFEILTGKRNWIDREVLHA